MTTTQELKTKLIALGKEYDTITCDSNCNKCPLSTKTGEITSVGDRQDLCDVLNLLSCIVERKEN